tara:strand:+ start:18818 stop:19246 length:429 start_codon:yes stop_codon:yes gene_type:complete
MSYNRLIYDQCAYKQELNQSTGSLEYLLNPMKYENCNKCRHEFGLVGGPNVSHIKGNLVDLENDLRGATRNISNCSATKYQPTKNNKITVNSDSCGSKREVDTNLVHLTPCQMVRYPPMDLPSAPNYDHCPAPLVSSKSPCN